MALLWAGLVFYMVRLLPPTIPPFEQLQVMQGKLGYAHRNGRIVSGQFIVINGKQFGCGSVWLGPNDCFFDKKLNRLMEGKQATMWWYEQKSFFGSSYSLMAQLDVVGVRIWPYERTWKSEWRSSEDWFRITFSWVMKGVFIAIIWVPYGIKHYRAYRQFKLN